MPKVNTFVADKYVNNIGQVLEPGDEVVAVVKRGDRIKTYKGRYDGIYVNKMGDVVSVAVFGGTRRCYKKVGMQEHVWNVRDYRTGVVTERREMRPVYQAYNRVSVHALPNRLVYKVTV